MPNPTIRVHNIETDEIIDREMTAEELAVIELAETERLAAEDEAKTKAAKKAAVLAALAETSGFTVEELAEALS